jgi:hypothetical protein
VDQAVLAKSNFDHIRPRRSSIKGTIAEQLDIIENTGCLNH